MREALDVTPLLEREYRGTNCWHADDAPFSSEIPCAKTGPHGGQCTLRAGHGGFIHIAHMYSLSSEGDHSTIYTAWREGDVDMEVDVGL